MATAKITGMPVDQPAMVDPAGGLVHREADFFANASPERGIYAGFGTSPESLEKGSRRPSMDEPQTAPEGGIPFTRLRN